MERIRQQDALLELRLRMALSASRQPDGCINHDWLAMHICLVLTDQLQAAHCRSNSQGVGGVDRKRAFTQNVREINASMKRVLPKVLPLMAEFSEMKRLFGWRAGGNAAEAAADPTFAMAAATAGIPITEDDFVYALGPEGPAGVIAFECIAEKVSSALMH